jgi:hypothetical protein
MDTEAIMQRIGGYVSNLAKLKELLLELKTLPLAQAAQRIEEEIGSAQGTWLTDLKILKNAFEELQS